MRKRDRSAARAAGPPGRTGWWRCCRRRRSRRTAASPPVPGSGPRPGACPGRDRTAGVAGAAPVLPSARAPPISAPPARTVPASPAAAPLRKLRRLTLMPGSLLALFASGPNSSGVTGPPVAQWVGGTSSRSGTDERVSSSAPIAPSTCCRCASETALIEVHCPAPGSPAEPAEGCSAAPAPWAAAWRSLADQGGQLAQHHPGHLQVGVGCGVGVAAALVVDPGQVVTQRVFEDFVRPQRQVGRIAREIAGGQVLRTVATSLASTFTTGSRVAALWPCQSPYSSRCRPVKSLSFTPLTRPSGSPSTAVPSSPKLS